MQRPTRDRHEGYDRFRGRQAGQVGRQGPGGHRGGHWHPSKGRLSPMACRRLFRIAHFSMFGNTTTTSAPGPQGRRPVVLAADHGANRKPALEEQAGHGSPDRSELTGCRSYEDRSVIGHATSFPFAQRQRSAAGAAGPLERFVGPPLACSFRSIARTSRRFVAIPNSVNHLPRQMTKRATPDGVARTHAQE
jgi:hypothetical protein